MSGDLRRVAIDEAHEAGERVTANRDALGSMRWAAGTSP